MSWVEIFPVGMISDEVETLRSQGHTDDQIADTIRANSGIEITGPQIAANYAPPDQRHPEHD